MNNTRHWVTLPFIRKNYEKTKSAKFKGNLEFVSNKNGIIFDWKINFKVLYIDQYTTKSWFKNKPLIFKIRKKLFVELRIAQKIRPMTSSNLIIKLTEKQIKITNNFFNDRNKYKSTIKSILGILKGNNPVGEAKNPSSTELIIDSNSKIKNFTILIDDLIMKESEKTEFKQAILGAQKMKLEEFIKLNSELEEAFNFMQKSKNKKDFKTYLLNIKDYYKNYNEHIKDAESLIKKERSKYSQNIDTNIINFPFKFKNKSEFQKCHIYQVHLLKEKIVYALREKHSYKNYVSMISDPQNFLPLEESHHRKFDSNYFTYKKDGMIWGINQEGHEYIKNNMDQKYKKIDSFFLTKKRKEYLDLRNQNINDLGSVNNFV